MAKTHSGGTALSTGIRVQANKPLDDRFSVDTFTNLLNPSDSIIDAYLYPWIPIVANDTGIRYKWNGQDRTIASNWVNDSSGVASSTGVNKIHFKDELYIPSSAYQKRITTTYVPSNITTLNILGYKEGSDSAYIKLVNSDNYTLSTIALEITRTDLGLTSFNISYASSVCYVCSLNVSSELYIKEITFQ